MRFEILGKPQSKKRHRSFIKNGTIATYDPQSQDSRKIKWECARQLRESKEKMYDENVRMEMKVFCQIPKSWSKKRKKSLDGQYCASKPDLDNYLKEYCDVLNGIAFHDDRQVVEIWCEKRYSSTPRVEINIYPEGKMVNEHAKTVRDEISIEDLNYMVLKANHLGKRNRIISRVFSQEDSEGKHIYFECEAMKE